MRAVNGIILALKIIINRLPFAQSLTHTPNCLFSGLSTDKTNLHYNFNNPMGWRERGGEGEILINRCNNITIGIGISLPLSE